MARARSSAPSERQYPTVYITLDPTSSLASASCKSQCCSGRRGGVLARPHVPFAGRGLTWTSSSSLSIRHWEAFLSDCPCGPLTHCPSGPHVL